MSERARCHHFCGAVVLALVVSGGGAGGAAGGRAPPNHPTPTQTPHPSRRRVHAEPSNLALIRAIMVYLMVHRTRFFGFRARLAET